MGNLVSEIGQGELKLLLGQCGRIHQESEALSGAVMISEYELHVDMYLPSLETTLRNFSCLTIGDGIMVAYNNKKYYIDIIESKPSNAISIIERDCEVDFAPPLDYKEPERPVAPVPLNKAAAQGTDFSILIAIAGPVCRFLSSLSDLRFNGCFLCGFFLPFFFLCSLFTSVAKLTYHFGFLIFEFAIMCCIKSIQIPGNPIFLLLATVTV